MKKTTPTKPLLEALAELNSSDGRTRSAAYHFLKSDLATLRTDEDFRRAYGGLMACLQLLGPLHESYRRCLNDLRRLLESFHRANAGMLPAAWLCQMEGLWASYREILRAYAPSQVVADLERMTNDYFNRLRGPHA